MTSTPIRRAGLLLLSLWPPLSALRAEEPALRELLRDALYTEEVTRDPEKAAKQYEALLARYDAQKTFAAAALFRLAEVRRKQDRKDDAIALYQRLIAEFPNAQTECKLARENLVALGGKLPEAGTAPALGNYEDEELARLEAKAKSSPDVSLDSATNLSVAANQGHAKIVKRMLDAGCKPYQGNALENAAQIGNLEIVKLLTDHPDPVPSKTANQALKNAIQDGRLTVLDFLLEKGLKPGNMIIEYALMENRIPCAEVLLKHGADLDEMVATDPGQGFEGMGTALHQAVSFGKAEVVKWLLEKGAKPDLPTLHFGLTPLHYAAKSEHPEALDIMKLLLEAGADPNLVSNDREAPDSLAKTILLNATPLETAIASHSMSLEKTELLLAHKADPNRKDTRVSAMLALAMGLDDPNAGGLVLLLGEAGFRMTDPGLMGNAVNAKKPKLIELLLKFGADPNTKDGEGNTFLAAACFAGDADRVQLLLKNGADPKQPGLLGQLIQRGPEAVPMTQILLDAGADPNAVDQSKRPSVVELFEWDSENRNSGNVYLHSDKRSDQAKLLELLLKHGLDPNTTYGEFVRSATSSPSRSGGNMGNPFLADATETKTYPKSLLMRVLEMEQARKVINVDMIGMLLDAGAKPTDEFPEVFNFVAKGYDSVPIAKALLPFRPQTLRLDRTDYFQNWNPQVKRLFLDEILNPAIAAQGGVHFVFADRGGSRRIVEPNQAVPPMAELMLAECGSVAERYTTYTGKREDPVITRVRRDAGGQWSRETIDWQGDGALPDLIPGDIIELDVGKLVSTADDKGQTLESLLSWHFRKRVSFPVTVEIDGKPRGIQLRGDLLSYDPTKNEAPLLSAGRLAMLFLPLSKDSGMEEVEPNSILTVRRKDGGETRMDLSASGAAEFQLKPGDHLILPEPENVIKRVEPRLRPVLLRVPGIAGARAFGPFTDTSIIGKPALPMPTLVQVLTDAYSPWRPWKSPSDDTSLDSSFPEISGLVQGGLVPVIVRHPDFSRIRITRTFEGGKEEILEVDLSKFIDECHEDTPDAEAKKADVMLFPGDVVELPLKEARAEQPWNGFTEAEERFFRKVLAGRLLTRKQDGIIESIAISYHQPDWKKTAHGLIPIPPKDGVSTTRLHDLSQKNGRGVNLKREGEILEISSNDPLVRGGDEIEVSVRSPRVVPPPMPQPPPVPQPVSPGQPRPRVVPPPSN